MRKISIRILFACFIVAAGLITLFMPEKKDIVMFCLGVAAGYIAPKLPTGDSVKVIDN